MTLSATNGSSSKASAFKQSTQSRPPSGRVRFTTPEPTAPSDSEANTVVVATPYTLLHLRHAAATDSGGKQQMEDVVLLVEDIEATTGRYFGFGGIKSLFAVFDGHGGVEAAEYARDHLLQAIVDHQLFPDNPEQCLRDAFTNVDQSFYMEAQKKSNTSGTTALAALVWGNTVYIANAGDSRAVLCNNGKSIQLTKDHRPTCEVELTRVTSCGGYVCEEARLNGHLAVTRSIGDYGCELKRWQDGKIVGPLTAEPDVLRHELCHGDEFIVLACDGLFDMFSSERVIEVARESLKFLNDPEQCCKELVDLAKKNHAADNLSVITMCFSNELPRKRPPLFSRSLSSQALATLQTALGELTN